MQKFNFEVTDTFGGEANYSWVHRHTIEAKSELGAIQKLAKITGRKWRKDWDSGDCTRYNAKNANVCAFLTYGGEN